MKKIILTEEDRNASSSIPKITQLADKINEIIDFINTKIDNDDPDYEPLDFSGASDEKGSASDR